ncbi:MAG: hypothetical protein F4X63_07375 [Nitrospira sp. SB0662_bin_26]|nr:hypothetical protein [Nitrospira sp. SB0662_bin_26]
MEWIKALGPIIVALVAVYTLSQDTGIMLGELKESVNNLDKRMGTIEMEVRLLNTKFDGLQVTALSPKLAAN